MSIITLTTDFGTKDYFVGAMKGKILTQLPSVTIVDISNKIDLFNIYEASYAIQMAYKSFPENTVHIIGVDSDLHTNKNHLAMQWENQYFICADNGILSVLTQKFKPQKIVSINIHNKLQTLASDMDVFITVACHLANGGVLSIIGNDITEIKELRNLTALAGDDKASIKGQVVYIDHFGNCVTNIHKKMFEDVGQNASFLIQFHNKKISRLNNFYADFKTDEKFNLNHYEGNALALFNESGFLEIAVYKSNPKSVGSASTLFGLQFRDTITITFTPKN